MRRGFTRFLPLLVIAILLIGFVGYVSVTRLKNSNKAAVLSDSSQSAQTKDDQQLNEDFGSEDAGLNDVGNLEVDLPGLKITPAPSEKPVSAEAIKSTASRTRKFLGTFDVNLSEDSFFVKYLDFLFSK